MFLFFASSAFVHNAYLFIGCPASVRINDKIRSSFLTKKKKKNYSAEINSMQYIFEKKNHFRYTVTEYTVGLVQFKRLILFANLCFSTCFAGHAPLVRGPHKLFNIQNIGVHLTGWRLVISDFRIKQRFKSIRNCLITEAKSKREFSRQKLRNI